MSFRINQYKEKKTAKVIPTTKSHTSSKVSIDRPLPRAPAPGNFNVNYTTLEVRIPNYTFGKAIELAGAGGLIAVCLGKRCLPNAGVF